MFLLCKVFLTISDYFPLWYHYLLQLFFKIYLVHTAFYEIVVLIEDNWIISDQTEALPSSKKQELPGWFGNEEK